MRQDGSLTTKVPMVVWGILTATVITKALSYMCLPFLSVYLAKQGLINPWIIGGIIGLSPLATLFGGFLGGQLSDILGRSNILYSSLFGIAVTCFGFYEAMQIKDPIIQAYFLSIFSFLDGLFISLYQPVSQALISDLLLPSQRSKVAQLRYSAMNIGAAIGPPIGALMGIVGTGTIFMIAGIVNFLYAVILCYSLSRKHYVQVISKQKKTTFSASISAVINDKKLLLFILSQIFFNFGYIQLDSTLGQFLTREHGDRGAWLFSVMMFTNAATVLVFQAPLYWLMKRIDFTKLFCIGTFIFAIGLSLFSLPMNSIPLLITAMWVASIGEVLIFPSSSLFIDDIAPTHLRGTYFGAASLRDFGRFLGPLVGGYLLYSNGRYVFIIMAIVSLISCIFQTLAVLAKGEIDTVLDCTHDPSKVSK